MMRGISDKNLLTSFCKEFCDIVNGYCKYIICSGFVAISSGRARATEDIDMIVEKIDKDTFFLLHKDLLAHDFLCMQSTDPEEIYTYLLDGLNVRYTYKDKPLPEMEVKFVKDELDDYQINTRVKLPLTGIDVWFGSINMNIAFKEEYLKSDKDIKDANHLRLVFDELVDEEEIRTIKQMIKRLRLQ